LFVISNFWAFCISELGFVPRSVPQINDDTPNYHCDTACLVALAFNCE